MTPSLPQAILFDLDDTLLDFSGGAESCWQKVCDQFAPECDGVTPERLLAALQSYRRWFWSDPARHRRGRLDMAAARREVVAGALRGLGVDAPGVVLRMAQAFGRARAEAIRLFPETVEVLARLRGLSVRLALVTNGERGEQRAKIERFALAPYFDYVLVEGEFGAGKPEARVYRHALARVAADPRDAWMVGDNLEWDVLGPQRVGIRGVWRDVAGKGLPASAPGRPDQIIRSLVELIPSLPQTDSNPPMG